MLHTIIYSTLGQLATGILLFIAVVPPSQIGKGFGRFHTMLALALWLIICWGSFGSAFWLFTGAVLLTAVFSQKDALYYPFLATSILLSFYLLARPELNSYGLGYALLVHVPAILVLGAGAVSMLLGHWYLVSPKLSIRYLKIMTLALIGALILRFILLSLDVNHAYSNLQQTHFMAIYGILLAQRVVLGLFLALVLSVMTYYCVRIRSTQSATGILYVVLVFCLVGEVIGRYLFFRTGVLF